VQQSETFNTTWSASNTVVTANQTTAPNGTTTADLVVDNANNTSHALTQSVTNLSVGLDYYYSIYVKNNNHTWVLLRHDNGGTFNYFNIATGVKGTNTQANSTIESVGNGWYKLTVPFNVTGSSSGPEFYLASADGTFTYAGTGTGVYIWGASYTLSAKPYFPTTDRLNVPRLTYQNGGGGCPSLLLEKQSTNLLTWSEDFTNATYTKIEVTATANTTTSPDGTTNADSILETATGGTHESWQRASMTSGQLYTQSCFLKANGRNRVLMQIFDNATQYASAIYDLSTGVVVASVGTATIQSMGNGWYRCTITGTSPATGSGYCVLGLCESTYTNSSVMPSYSGDASKGVYWWGFQVENSSYPTSYIPTTSASATRVADVCSVNLSNTNMTFCAYLECDEAPLGITAGDWLTIENVSSNLGRAYGYANQFGFADAYSMGVISGTKMIWKQESGTTAKVFKGGALVATSTTGTYSNPFNRFRIDGAYLDKPLRIKEFVFFDNNLTDAECIALTA
jgi:hypothetical protein